MRNWKTTVAGVATILTGLGSALSQFASGGIAAVDFGILLTAITGGAGLVFAKDFNVSGTPK